MSLVMKEILLPDCAGTLCSRLNFAAEAKVARLQPFD